MRPLSAAAMRTPPTQLLGGGMLQNDDSYVNPLVCSYLHSSVVGAAAVLLCPGTLQSVQYSVSSRW